MSGKRRIRLLEQKKLSSSGLEATHFLEKLHTGIWKLKNSTQLQNRKRQPLSKTPGAWKQASRAKWEPENETVQIFMLCTAQEFQLSLERSCKKGLPFSQLDRAWRNSAIQGAVEAMQLHCSPFNPQCRRSWKSWWVSSLWSAKCAK